MNDRFENGDISPCDSEMDPERARDKALRDTEAQCLRFLAKKDHSRQGLIRKMSRHAPNPSILDEVLDDFEARGWLNDQRFAERQAELLIQKFWGPQQIVAKLCKHGIRSSLASEALQKLEPDWFDVCLNDAQRRPRPSNRDEKAKLYRYLTRRGHWSSVIRSVIDRIESM